MYVGTAAKIALSGAGEAVQPGEARQLLLFS